MGSISFTVHKRDSNPGLLIEKCTRYLGAIPPRRLTWSIPWQEILSGCMGWRWSRCCSTWSCSTRCSSCGRSRSMAAPRRSCWRRSTATSRWWRCSRRRRKMRWRLRSSRHLQSWHDTVNFVLVQPFPPSLRQRDAAYDYLKFWITVKDCSI